MSRFETVIGLEVHIQLSTKSKAFCSDLVSFGASSNTNISPISLGYPGTLPKSNVEHIESAIRLGIALDSEINPHQYFDRKHYFYADLPKGYQITQDAQPICLGGHVHFYVDQTEKTIRIHHIHMEEDAGKLLHSAQTKTSLADYNRAGTPLLECVTEPDFRSAEEVYHFMHYMRQLVRFLRISDGNMEEGSMRADCNVSIRPIGSTSLGERCEIKNVNSARYAQAAINYEVQRQIEIVTKGGSIQRTTMEYDPVSNKTYPLRSKEEAKDYRYFPEPDLTPIHVSEQMVQRLRDTQPKTAIVFQRTFETMNLHQEHINVLLDQVDLAHYAMDFLSKAKMERKPLANFIVNQMVPYCRDIDIEISNYPLTQAQIESLMQMVADRKVIASKAFQELLPKLLEQPQEPEPLAKRLGLMVNDVTEADMTSTITNLLLKHPAEVERYRSGKKGLIGFFIGQLMKQHKGLDPQAAKNELINQLDK